jgi:hypothetical protein
MAGRPKGATNKLKAGRAHEICEEESVCPFRRQLQIAQRLYDEGEILDAAKIYNSLMKYLYAPLAPVTLAGDAAPVNLIFSDPKQIEDQIDKLRELNGKTT